MTLGDPGRTYTLNPKHSSLEKSWNFILDGGLGWAANHWRGEGGKDLAELERDQQRGSLRFGV